MVGLTFCIIMLPSARESRVARAGCRTYTRSTRRGTCRALHSRAPARLCVGRCGRASIAVCRAAAAAVPRVTSGMRRRRHARVAECSAPGSRAQSRAAAVHRGQAQLRAAAGVRRPPAPSAVRSAARVLLRRCAVAGAVTRRLRSRAPPQECVGRCQRADNAVARADGDPRGTECPRIYACARACQYECTQSNLQNASSCYLRRESHACHAPAESHLHTRHAPWHVPRNTQPRAGEAVRRPLRPSNHRSVPRRRRCSAEVHKRDAPATSRKGGGVRFTWQPSAVARTAAEASAALRAAERSRGVCRARPLVCVGRRRSAQRSARLHQSVTAPLSRCRRSRAPPQECVGRCQRAAPPWHALMAIRRAPNVRGFTLVHAK
jgi:hypothetical protein